MSKIYLILNWKGKRYKLKWNVKAGDRNWTRDLLITNQLLYQLSYASIKQTLNITFILSFVNPLRGLKEILLLVSGYLEDGIGSDSRVGNRNLNRMISAELVIPKDMFSSQQLVGPVFKKAGGIFQTVDIMATGPDLEISKVGA